MIKKKRRKKNKPAEKLTPKQIAQAAHNHLGREQFSEAIKKYRSLHNGADDDRWETPLKEAFTGRIRQLAGKGMLKESLTIYDNMANLLPVQLPIIHIPLLIQTDRGKEAGEAYHLAIDSLERHGLSVLNEIITALLMGGYTDFLDFLPESSLLHSHYPHASQALQAYCSAGQAQETLEHLARIPFRSPYKNFKFALKGMALFADDREAAQSNFAKIPKDSPFYNFITPFRCIDKQHDDKQHDSRKIKLTKTEKQVCQHIAGLPTPVARLIEKLQKKDLTASDMFSLFAGSTKILPVRQCDFLCRRLLIHAPEKIPLYVNRFKEINDPFEQIRIDALISEIAHDFFEALKDWDHALKILHRDIDNHINKEKSVAILYHLIGIVEDKLGSDYKQIGIELLQSLIKLAPDDKNAMVMMANMMKGQTARRYQLVNEMAAKFPDDREVLQLAVEVTVERKAFKKAARLAASLLDADPLNKKVRLMLIESHLAHARKLYVQGKEQLTRKECEQAGKYLRPGLGTGGIECRMGLLLILSNDDKTGLKMIAESYDKAGHPVVAGLRIILEATSLACDQKHLVVFKADLKKACKTPADKTSLLKVSSILYATGLEDTATIKSFISPLNSWFKKALQLEFNRKELNNICKGLSMVKMFPTLKFYASNGLKKSKDDPLFIYYNVLAAIKGINGKLSRRQFDILDQAWGNAMAINDHTAAELIDELLSKYSRQFDEYGFDKSTMDEIEKIKTTNPELVEEMEKMFEQDIDPTGKGGDKGEKEKPKQFSILDLLNPFS